MTRREARRRLEEWPDAGRTLSKHYSFTGEELDSIINYDIKYRMGREEEGSFALSHVRG